jgi:tRNA A-37 threonylcarbamoyl transferase component Bud32
MAEVLFCYKLIESLPRQIFSRAAYRISRRRTRQALPCISTVEFAGVHVPRVSARTDRSPHRMTNVAEHSQLAELMTEQR